MKFLFKAIKKYFFAGIFALLPIGITFYAIFFVSVKINQFVLAITPQIYSTYVSDHALFLFYRLLILFAVLFLFCLLGVVVHLYIGKKLLALSDFFMKKIPFFNKFYGVIKKITGMICDEKSHFFDEVVRIEFPQKGMYSLAFLTNSSQSFLIDSEDRYVHVFLPTSPNPTTGFFLIVKRDSLQKVDMSLEDAMKLIISAGALC